jgi:hypothetical protein
MLGTRNRTKRDKLAADFEKATHRIEENRKREERAEALKRKAAEQAKQEAQQKAQQKAEQQAIKKEAARLARNEKARRNRALIKQRLTQEQHERQQMQAADQEGQERRQMQTIDRQQQLKKTRKNNIEQVFIMPSKPAVAPAARLKSGKFAKKAVPVEVQQEQERQRKEDERRDRIKKEKAANANRERIKKDMVTQIKRRIVNFQNTDNEEKATLQINTRDIPNFTEETIKDILSVLTHRPAYMTLLKNGSEYFTFQDRHNFLKPIEEQTESEKSAIINVMNSQLIELTQQPRKKQKPEGAFFPYLNKTNLKLETLGVFKQLPHPTYFNVGCLNRALMHAGIQKEELSFIIGRTISQKTLKAISEKLKIQITLSSKSQNVKIYNKNEALKNVNLGLFHGHYFINGTVTVSEFAIKNYEEIKHLPDWNLITERDKDDKGNPYYKKRTDEAQMSALRCLKLMLDGGLFEKMDLSTVGILETQFYDKVSQTITNVTNDESREFSDIKEQKNNQNIYFADFESLTDEEKHRAFMLCYSNLDGSLIKTAYGEDAIYNLLETVPDGSTVYFHNLGYDNAFIMGKKKTQGIHIIRTGSLTKMYTCQYKNKKIKFCDSYAMISEALAKFAEMFKIPNIQKEFLPYGAYNSKTINKATLNLITEVLPYVDIKKMSHSDFINSANAKGCLINIEYDEDDGITIKDAQFNHMKYAKFYCLQDVETLRVGMVTFNEMFKKEFNINTYDFLSLPALAKEYLKIKGCFDECREISGNTRAFIQKSIIGGRVHLPGGSQIVEEEINALDAVSLYPSAMSQMGFLKGTPKILTSKDLNYDFLKNKDGYFIELKNVKVSVRRPAPLQSIKNEQGTRIFTNDFKPEHSLYVDKIALEDFIKYQGATFDIIRGYYFDEGRNYKISETIKYMFQQRKKYQDEKNPIELIYKLMLNASYGKLIEKPRFTKTILKVTKPDKTTRKGGGLDAYLSYNYNSILNFSIVSDDMTLLTVKNEIDSHFNAAHLGSEVLSMSKRLINEVMTTAEDLKYPVFYQDTDSLHVLNNDIEPLAEEFKKRYGRELLGDQLGQFHGDLKIKGSDNVISILAVYVNKKVYYEKLKGTDKITGKPTTKALCKLKGVSNGAIEKAAGDLHDGDILKVYKDLLNGEPVKFDLLAGRVSFKRNKDETYTSLKEFYRVLNPSKVNPTL